MYSSVPEPATPGAPGDASLLSAGRNVPDSGPSHYMARVGARPSRDSCAHNHTDTRDDVGDVAPRWHSTAAPAVCSHWCPLLSLVGVWTPNALLQ